MATVKAPLLSLGASGKIAGTLVASTWKGLKVMREYVKPANPQTAAQTTQRDLFSASVNAWRNYVTNANERAAWDRKALQAAHPQSGFNAAMSAMSKILAADADASFAASFAAAAGNTVAITMKNMDDGAVGDEAGNFEVWAGDQPGSLLLNGTAPIAAGVITTADLGDLHDVKYVELRKTSRSRSGIMKVTLIA
jgi:hypothetical protein